MWNIICGPNGPQKLCSPKGGKITFKIFTARGTTLSARIRNKPFPHISTTKKRIDAIYLTPSFSGLELLLPWSHLALKSAQGAFKTALHLRTKRNLSCSRHDTPCLSMPACRRGKCHLSPARSHLFVACVAVRATPSGKSMTVHPHVLHFIPTGSSAD